MRLRYRFVLLGLTVLGPLAAFGCRGAVDRVYEDDTPDDASVGDSTVSGDAPVASDASGDRGVVTDSSTDATDAAAPDGSDSAVGNDAGDASDAASDSPVDAPVDAPVGNDAGDGAPGDGGCGPTNTIQNCAACGNTCDLDGSTSTISACNGTTCVYTCRAGRQDCNNAAPNTNACECVGTGCCGASCQVIHSNGVGQNYYDCVEAGTINQAQATKACQAYSAVFEAGACSNYGCTGNAGQVVCTAGVAPNCVCWKWDPGNSGVNGKVSTSCACPINPAATDWN
jgi:hypothetical protein